MHLSNEEYDLLCQSDEAWCCPDCLKQALPYHDCSHISSGSTFTGNTILPQPNSHLPSSQSCSMYYANCRSLLPKIDELCAQVASHSPEIVADTESWLDQF